jgi:hypothetical protein
MLYTLESVEDLTGIDRFLELKIMLHRHLFLLYELQKLLQIYEIIFMRYPKVHTKLSSVGIFDWQIK